MPRLIENLTDEPHQIHIIIFDESEITLDLRFHPTVQMWCIGIEYKGHETHGTKLSLGIPHLVSRNYPFDFIVADTSGTGLDPFRLDDFVTGRCELYMLERTDMEVLRGAPVPL